MSRFVSVFTSVLLGITHDGVNFLAITPSRVLWPGLAILLTVLSINYIGDGLRDALNPRIRGR